jgi:hypothetical protein
MAARKGLFGLTSTRAGEAAINWYPGHMASATKAIRERIKLVDLVLEVRDARVCLKPFPYYSLPCHVCVFLALVVLSSFCLFSCTFSDTIVISKCRAARCIGAQEAPDCSQQNGSCKSQYDACVTEIMAMKEQLLLPVYLLLLETKTPSSSSSHVLLWPAGYFSKS